MVTDVRLQYVTEERLPSGNVRYRFRRNGKKVTLKGEPGSREFHEHYTSLLDDKPQAVSRSVRGSVEWLVGLYLDDLDRRAGNGLASPLTLRGHRHHLGKLIARYGRKSAEMPRSRCGTDAPPPPPPPAARRRRRNDECQRLGFGARQAR